MDIIIEELIRGMIKRIEALEQKFDKIEQTRTKPGLNQEQSKPGMATPGQLKYIRILKGIADPNMTRDEAGVYIDKLLKNKNNQSQISESDIDSMYEKPTEQEIKESKTGEINI